MLARLFVFSMAACLCLSAPGESLDISVKPSRETAFTPEQSLKSIELDGPYEAQLVASEPLVRDPVEMTWDAKGRCFVADMMDYPLGPPPGEKPLSRIVLLLDPDKNGRYTKSKVFADHMDHVQGLLPYKDGLIATTRTQILFLRDTNGDGVADEIKPLVEGFNPTHSQLQVASPRWGLDNCVYFNNGLNTGEIYPSANPDGKMKVARTNLRWDPATGKLELATGNGQYGGCFDDWGRHFFCSNRNPVMFAVMPYEAVIRNPHAGITQGWEDIAPTGADAKVYPLMLTHTTADAHAGTHTAACGLGVYRGDLMPELRGEIFVCEPTAQCVVRYHVEPNGASFKATRVGDHTEFFRSSDEWCRPVNVTTGPDGALYICDIYRRFIDHARFFPEEFQKTHNMRAGENEGRIWRIVPKGVKPRAIEPAPEKVEDLVAWLGHKNAWQRETAQRLLVETGTYSTRSLLEMVRSNQDPLFRVHAMSIVHSSKSKVKSESERAEYLHSIFRWWREDWPKAYHDQPRVLENYLSWAYEHKEIGGPSMIVASGLKEMEAHPDARVRFMDLLRYGVGWEEYMAEMDAPKNKLPEFQKMFSDASETATKHFSASLLLSPEDTWLQKAVLASAPNRTGRILSELIRDVRFSSNYSVLKADFVKQCAVSASAFGDVLDFRASCLLLDQEKSKLLWWKPALLQGLAEGLPKSGGKLGVKSLAELTAKPPEAYKEAAAEITALLAQVDRVMSDPSAPLEQRLAVIPLLSQRTWDKAEPIMRGLLLADNQQADITAAALAMLRKFSTDKTAPLLYELLPKLSPAPRRDVVAMLSTGKMTLDFLQRMERGEVSKSLVGAEQRWGFQHSGSKEIKELATKLFGSVNSDRAAVINAYTDAAKKKGDAQKGRQIFQTICIACHKIRGEGVEVGPDISDVRIKEKEALLVDILDPNRICEPRFMAYQVDTKDGRVVSGIVAAENSDSVTLKLAGGLTEAVPRANIKAMKCLDQSLMPVGLEATITKEQMADLLSFLKGE